MSSFSLQDWLNDASHSSAATVKAFEALLSGLEHDARRAESLAALRTIHDWYAASGNADNAPHFSFSQLRLPAENGELNLDLLQLPSVFAPEEWSFTFYEGLIRIPVAEFERMAVAESGCGNGWISMALARRARPTKIYGLDINPRAILCARLNLYLNAHDADGNLILDGEGKSLLDRVEFQVSDLLGYCLEQQISLDRVVGCIPQVLNPDVEESLSALGDQASDEALLSLSNYCGLQGYVEDQFGLGLMARVLEESIEILRPQGAVVFNMGGRPGDAVLRRLFARRGFDARQVWQTRAVQAGDTEIEALVEIERGSSHRFEFFSDLNAEEPIDARTALAFARAGGEISHAITVFGARLRHPVEVRRIFSTLRKSDFPLVARALDLAFSDTAKSEEKCSFLASMSETLAQDLCFPYEDTAGAAPMRRQLAKYFAHYFRIDLAADCFTTFPSRGYLFLNVATVDRPRRVLFDRELLSELPEDFPSRLAEIGAELLEMPRRGDVARDLMVRLEPDLVVTAMNAKDMDSVDAFQRLVDAAAEAGARLIVDISQSFELSSSPSTNGVLKSLANQALPAHVGVSCALIRGQVYPALELSFLITENGALSEALTYAAELSYSRTPRLTQAYYERILADLSSFRLARPETPREPRHPVGALQPAELAEECRRAFAHPALDAHRLPLDAETLRLDYGENSLPTPARLRERILESFARRHLGEEECDPRAELARFLRGRFGLPAPSGQEIVVGSGVAPLFAAALGQAKKEGARLLLPRGSYGFFTAVADFQDLDIDWIETSARRSFKVGVEDLKTVCGDGRKRWLYLNAPVVNPTGAIYSSEELTELLRVAAELGTTVILDTIFAGLEFETPAARYDIGSVLRQHPTPDIILLGGISKEFAAGGLRFGYAWANASRHRDALAAEAAYALPHNTLKFAMTSFFEDLNRSQATVARDAEAQRKTLAQRAERLCDELEELGWTALRPRGGLFVMAYPTSLLGQSRDGLGEGRNESWVLDEENIADALFFRTGLLVNGGRWTGLSGYCRFVLSVDTPVFESALAALKRF